MAISNLGAVEVTPGEDATLVDIAHSLEPLIREHAEELEDRHVPPRLVAALYDTGVFRAMLPREVGGLEAEPVEWLRMIEELARVDASVGWLAFIQSGVGLTFLDPERFERFRVRGGGRLILAMSLGRLGGKAVRVDGGYRVTGRWPFASGSPVRSAKEAVGLIFEMAGSGAVYRGRPVEKAFRDINTAANHTNYVETAYTAIGSYFLTRGRAGGPDIAGRPFF